ncbi:MAG: hypothetical protein ACRDKE_06630 [Solirubrobacterales bacterium]
MAKAVEVAWNLTPFRSDEFCDILKPYAERVINYGATGFLLVRQADDELIVKQYAWFEKKEDWERYWNSELMQECRAKLLSHYAVPVLYTWQEVVAFNKFPDDAEVPAEVEA